MQEISTAMEERRTQALARLSVLQRLRDQAIAGDRVSMFASIDRLMESESQALKNLLEFDPKGPAGSTNVTPD